MVTWMGLQLPGKHTFGWVSERASQRGLAEEGRPTLTLLAPFLGAGLEAEY